jgi:hypothetical protein
MLPTTRITLLPHAIAGIVIAALLVCWEKKRVSLLEPNRGSEPLVREINANEDGLFDVTDLGIV